MSDPKRSSRAGEPAADAPLNPALQRSTELTHGSSFEGTDPMESVSVKDGDEGSSWPMIWAVVAVVCVLVTAYLLLA
jgi:hypothetical protein